MDWNETVIPVGKGDEGFDVSPDGRELWTANAQDGTLSVIDLATRTVTATLDAKTFGANRLKFTPDGKLVLISSLGDGDLVIYDAASRKEFKRVKIGHGAAGILIDPDGNRAFIACGPDNYVAVLDLKTFEVTEPHRRWRRAGRSSLGDKTVTLLVGVSGTERSKISSYTLERRLGDRPREISKRLTMTMRG